MSAAVHCPRSERDLEAAIRRKSRMSTSTRSTFPIARRRDARRLSPVRRAAGGLLAQEYRRGDCGAESFEQAHRGDSSRCRLRLDFVPRSDREMVLVEHPLRAADAGDDSPVGEECGQLFERLREWGVCADGAQICIAGRAACGRWSRAKSRCRRCWQRARVNLKNPPRIFTEIAIEQLPDIVSFFEHDVPLAFADAKDPALKAEFAQTNAAVIAALKSYLDWLKTDLLARSNGDFRIGAETFSKKLQYDEMVDMPLDKLLEIGWADLRKNQAHFKEVAKELEPDKDAARGARGVRRESSRARSFAGCFSRHLRRPGEFHPLASYCHHSLGCAADRGRDAAFHARHDLCQHGYAGAV